MSPPRESLQVLVIGGGISGLAALKCLKDSGCYSLQLLERSDRVGGLWAFREKDPYGVMAFTHINVSKANYCFSDWPFPDHVTDYPHHSEMAAYIESYVEHFDLDQLILFGTEVTVVRKQNDGFLVTARHVASGEVTEYEAEYVAIATGHHGTPSLPNFEGEFGGTSIVHSAAFKSSEQSDLSGNVLVVGIGNSAVDVATNAATSPRVDKVFLSTRSGAWIVPNYVMGYPVDLYACRFFLKILPLKIANAILEAIITALTGHPRRWRLNPKMDALSTQPTVSPTLIHHIQRGHIEVVDNVARFEGGRMVRLVDGRSLDIDHVILCTGYRIDLDFLAPNLREQVIRENNDVHLYKNMFSPGLGPRLAFIGIAQPSSGGLLAVSEMQARWFAEVVQGRDRLPSEKRMEEEIAEDKARDSARFFKSARHTIQVDPIRYNDEIATRIGARPQFWRNPALAWRLMFGSCGTFQWRLQGPNRWSGARAALLKVPVTPMMHATGVLCLVMIAAMLAFLVSVVRAAV